MKDIIILEVYKKERTFEDGKGTPLHLEVSHTVDFKIDGTNITGVYKVTSVRRTMTEEELKEKIQEEIYGSKSIGTLTATIDLDATEFKERLSEVEKQLDMLGDKAKNTMSTIFKTDRETMLELEAIGDNIEKKIINKLAKDIKTIKYFPVVNGEKVVPIEDVKDVIDKALKDIKERTI